MNAKIGSVLMLVVGAVIGGGLVMVLSRNDRAGDAVREESSTRDVNPSVFPVESAAEKEPHTGTTDVVAEATSLEGAGVEGDDDDGSFEELMARVFAGEADDDEQLEFWEQLRTTNKLDGVIDSLRQQVDEDEEDVAGRMTLAQLYVMKLLSAPAGPERGLLAEKSQALWGEVLELDPDNFDAQYRIAFSLSQYPDFLNRTDDAIEAFEKAIAIEERVGASGETAQAYVNLARLHQKGGDPASALEVLERGMVAHPENEVMSGQLEKLKKGFVFESE